MSGSGGGFARVSERTIYEGRIISLAVGTFSGPDGTTFERDVVHHPGAVAVVPLLDDGTGRHGSPVPRPLDRLLLEIPAGIRDVGGEPPEETAKRELVEEVGLETASVELLCEIDNAAGFCDERYLVYLARDLRPVDNALQGIEEQHMTVEHLSLDEVPELIASGELTDAKSVIGLTLTMRRLGR